MIVNEKTVDPSDSSSPPVFQLETAMGAAIGVFEGARAIRVPRSRFVPVKKTSDLLVLRSDAYVLGDGARIELGRRARRRRRSSSSTTTTSSCCATSTRASRRARRRCAAAERLAVARRRDASARDVVVRGAVDGRGPAPRRGRRASSTG